MRKLRYIIIGCFLVVGIRFFGGVYESDEFNENYFFIKNKPTWKWSFHSPRGLDDTPLSEMTEEDKEEQLLFDEYVKNRVLEISYPAW